MTMFYFLMWGLQSPLNFVIAVAVGFFLIRLGLLWGQVFYLLCDRLSEKLYKALETFGRWCLNSVKIGRARIRQGRKARSREEFIGWLRDDLHRLGGMPKKDAGLAAQYIWDLNYPEDVPPWSRISFDDPDFAWTRSAARELVKADIENWG